MKTLKLSLVVPCYNEAENVIPFQKAVVQAFDGCGYDYEILCDDGIVYFVEVKGIADSNGGILFTSKEWCVASEMGDLYYLCIVRNINSPTPTIQYILNPAKSLSPTKNIKATIQISYSVSDKELLK